MRWRGLSQFQMNTVAATFFLVTFATDIPTGAFADAIGRRTAFLIGSAISTLGFTIYFFSHHFSEFLVAECFDGVGFTFRNGAVDAWAVDALDAAGYTAVKDRLFSRVSQLMRIGNMCGALIGAYVGAHNLAIPWLLGACGLALSGFVGSRLMDRDVRRDGKFDPGVIATLVKERIGQGMRIGFGTRVVFLLALAGGIQLAAWGPSWFEWPAYFSDRLNSGVQVVGWLFCIFNLAGMAGSEMAARLYLDRARRGIFMAGDDGARQPADVGRGRRCGPRGDRAGDVRPDQLLRRAGPAGAAELVQRADRRRVSRHAALVPDHLRDFRRSRWDCPREAGSRTASGSASPGRWSGFSRCCRCRATGRCARASIAPELAAEPAD